MYLHITRSRLEYFNNYKVRKPTNLEHSPFHYLVVDLKSLIHRSKTVQNLLNWSLVTNI
jgi:hypothetical protein